MKNIVKFDTAIQLDNIGYKPDEFQWRSDVYYAVDKILIRSDYDSYTLTSGELFNLGADDDIVQGKYVAAPCFSEVQQWIYNKYKLFIEIHIGEEGELFWNIKKEYGSDEKFYSKLFDSYDEYFENISDAYESAIIKCIEYIKNK